MQTSDTIESKCHKNPLVAHDARKYMRIVKQMGLYVYIYILIYIYIPFFRTCLFLKAIFFPDRLVCGPPNPDLQNRLRLLPESIAQLCIARGVVAGKPRARETPGSFSFFSGKDLIVSVFGKHPRVFSFFFPASKRLIFLDCSPSFWRL